ncbi:MAG: response regulator [Deltaproteobacteria bacterium]|nr:response regulator [Deltaproteobacteria bacterium]
MTDSSLNILVVDDFATMRQIVRKALKQLGYNHVFEADDGTSALEVLKKEKIQFIIADWNMPQMPGIELLKTVRSNEEWKGLPFLMITAEGQRGYVLEAVKHKVSNYIVKPFTPEVLKEKINKILETK